MVLASYQVPYFSQISSGFSERSPDVTIHSIREDLDEGFEENEERKCCNAEIRINKCVLAATSEFLAKCLKDSNGDDSSRHIYADVKIETLEFLHDFATRGLLKFDPTNPKNLAFVVDFLSLGINLRARKLLPHKDKEPKRRTEVPKKKPNRVFTPLWKRQNDKVEIKNNKDGPSEGDNQSPKNRSLAKENANKRQRSETEDQSSKPAKKSRDIKEQNEPKETLQENSEEGNDMFEGEIESEINKAIAENDIQLSESIFEQTSANVDLSAFEEEEEEKDAESEKEIEEEQPEAKEEPSTETKTEEEESDISDSVWQIFDKTHNKEDENVCVNCGYNEDGKKSAAQFQRHVAKSGKFHDDKCEHCDIKLNSWNEKKDHIKDAHDDNWRIRCELCGDCFDVKEVFDEHLKAHKKGRKSKVKVEKQTVKKENKLSVKLAKCEICWRYMNTKDELKAHLKTHEENNVKAEPVEPVKQEEEPFECQICQEVIYDEKVFRKHEKNCKANFSKYKCKTCEDSFSSKAFLLDHVYKFCKLTCEICNETIKGQIALQEHKSAHAEEEKVTCDYCGEAMREEDFDEHKSDCNKFTRPYGCTSCTMKFKEINQLTKHAKMHRKTKKRDQRIA